MSEARCAMIAVFSQKWCTVYEHNHLLERALEKGQSDIPVFMELTITDIDHYEDRDPARRVQVKCTGLYPECLPLMF